MTEQQCTYPECGPVRCEEEEDGVTVRALNLPHLPVHRQAEDRRKKLTFNFEKACTKSRGSKQFLTRVQIRFLKLSDPTNVYILIF